MKKLIVCLFGLLFSIPAMSANLPSGYTELEYVNMSAGSYLLTDIVPTYDGRVEMDFRTTTVPSGSAYLLGGRTETYGGLFVAKGSSGTVIIDSFGDRSSDRYTSSVSLGNNTRYKFVYDNQVSTLTSGGTTLFTNTSTGALANGAALCINGLNSNGTVSGAQSGIYLYSFKVWNAQGELVAGYVPAKNSSGVIGMYDLADTNPATAFHTNAGSGEFTAGEYPSTCNANTTNLANMSASNVVIGQYIASNGVVGESSANFYNQEFIPVQPNKTYTLGFDTELYYVSISEYDENQTFIKRNAGTTGGNTSLTITTGATTKYIRFGSNMYGNSNTLTRAQVNSVNWMLTESSTAQPYVPYSVCHATCPNGGTLQTYTSATGTVSQSPDPTPEHPVTPVFYQQGNMILRAVGSGDNIVADSYDATTGKITRRVGVKVFDGTEDWEAGLPGVLDKNYSITKAELNTSATALPNGSRNILSTHYSAISDVSATEVGRIWVGNSYINFNYNNTSTAAGLVQFKQFLAEQYANGTPVTVWYPLATETTEDWPATRCETGIKIATTKYNNAAFSGVVTALNNAVDTIKTVVANTINQATAVANLQSGKQTMPDSTATNGTCPNYKQCLLVEDESGTPHWYEIMDPFYNLFSAVIPNNVSATGAGVTNGYTQLEYITFSGTQYIDTGLAINNNTRVLFDVKRSTSSAQSNYPWLGGVRDYVINTNINKKTLEFSNKDSTKLYLQYATSGEITLTVPDTTQRHTYDFNKNELYIDENLIYTATQETFMGNATFLIGTLYSQGSVSTGSMFYGDVYGFKLWQDGTNLSMDLIPAKRNSDNVIGMYDLVSGQFFTNAGTGDFTAGNPVANDANVPGPTTWAMTFGANAPLDVRYNVNGSAVCNATLGTANTAATSTQMTNANWTASGNYCWCNIDSVTDQNNNSSTGKNIWVWLEVPSGETCVVDCAENCADAVASGAAADKSFRQAMTGM